MNQNYKLKRTVNDLTPPVVLRLRFMECALVHYGHFYRKFIMDYFGITQVQVSTDIAQYDLLAPGNITYGGIPRRYVPGPTFKRLWPADDEQEG